MLIPPFLFSWRYATITTHSSSSLEFMSNGWLMVLFWHIFQSFSQIVLLCKKEDWTQPGGNCFGMQRQALSECSLAVGRCEMECCHKQDSIPFNSLLSLSSTSKFLWAIFQRCNLFDYNLLKYAIEMVQKISIISHIQLQYLVGFQNVKCLRATSTMCFPRYQNRFFFSYKFFFMLVQEKHPSLFFMEVS